MCSFFVLEVCALGHNVAKGIARKTPVVFVPSNLCMASPNKAGDLDMAALNFLTSMSMKESIWFDLVSASTHVDAGSQNLRTSARM